MKKHLKVAVLFGGMSAEHDISMMTGKAIVKNLPGAGYQAIPVVIGRDGRFRFPEVDSIDVETVWYPFHEAVTVLHDLAPDCVLIGLHGTWGEDGRIQSLCDLMGLPYAGADSIGSAVGIDKWATKAVYLASGIPTPDAVMLQGDELDRRDLLDAALNRTGFPVVIKATRQGSSVGVAVVRSEADFDAALAEVRTHSDMVLFERFHKGREFSVPVLEDPETGILAALPIIEIVVKKAAFFDFKTKYDPKAADEICPAQVVASMAAMMSANAIAAHRALMLSGYSRTDFIAGIDDNGKEAVWALETNTLPGMTEFSLLPKSAAAAGMSYPQLLDVLIRNALK
jgi:D-alanine-D-alanine ligase